MTTYESNIAIIGGGLGGVAAALAALSCDEHVVLTERTDWIGGQATSQGVSAFDEHQYIESFGGTSSYVEFRDRIRKYYRETHELERDVDEPLDPGNCWVSRLAFEPRVGLDVLEGMLDELAAANDGKLTILREHRPVDATVADGRVQSVELTDGSGKTVRVSAEYFLDATELGDLLPMTGTDYVTGAESRSDTTEPNAKDGEPKPDEVQSFTYCFALEHRPGEDHTIEKPDGYERFRDEQPYTFDIDDHDDGPQYRMFEKGPDGELPFWTYRRLIDADQFADRERDVAMINWSGNDYYGANIIDRPEAEREEILAKAKRLACGFLYWLQTEAPRDDGGTGYPGLRLLHSVMGTEDGLSKYPYIRESRRIKPVERVLEQDVASYATSGTRAKHFRDSVGIGQYAIDIHKCVGNPDAHAFADTSPFQIPFRTFLSDDGPQNLLPACKNIGTTHLTNGTYRLHPVEWNVGEAAGVAASYCRENDVSPTTLRETHVRQFQYRLVEQGIPIVWTTDVPPTDELFVPTQLLAVERGFPSDSPRHDRLDVQPDDPLTGADLLAAAQSLSTILEADGEITVPADLSRPATGHATNQTLQSLGIDTDSLSDQPTWRELCLTVAPVIHETLS